VAARSKEWVCGRSLAGIAGSNPAGGMDVSFLLSGVCCQVEVSATGWSLVQRSPTEKILRRIFGPTKENQTWRVKSNEELDKLIKHKNIINYIKAQRLSWFGHVQRMPDTRRVKKMFNWKPLSKRSQGRPKYRWEDNITQDICQMKIKNWIACV